MTTGSAAAGRRGGLRPVPVRPVGDLDRGAEARAEHGSAKGTNVDFITPTAASPTGVVGLRPHAEFRHEAVLHRDGTALLADAVRFLAEGVDAGQAVMVQAPASVLKRLAPELGAAAHGVRLVDADELGTNPALSTDVWLGFAAENEAGRPARGLAVPAGHARRPAVVAEQQLAEAPSCAGIDPDTPLWLRCAYDLERIDSATVRHVDCSHPHLVLGALPRPSRRDAVGVTHPQGRVEQRFPAPAAPGLPFTFVRTTDLATVRRRVQAHTAAVALSAAAAYNLTLAVHELAVDALTFGGGPSTLLLGRERAALMCEVRDSGHVPVPATAPRHPCLDPPHRRGLWLANQLCDLVQVRSGSWGTATRITTWL